MFDVPFIEFELDEGDKKCGNEGGSHLKNVEVEKAVENVGCIAILLHFNEYFIGAHLEHLVHVVKKGQKVISKVTSIAVSV